MPASIEIPQLRHPEPEAKSKVSFEIPDIFFSSKDYMNKRKDT